ncbi:MAG: transglycosylase domain-containing protein [Fusobacterium sp.]|uniref:transglycosylase domain-containing protein n=1 Tax=Fusobacterium sp. TaxID=68766 RepID=UPI0026DD54AD|nr:transglycosylase domain-containing protein [Fusobacterium sp.]MDO4691044.1 transglycosylase domain-containing protein [Fusobacterium sp.]
MKRLFLLFFKISIVLILFMGLTVLGIVIKYRMDMPNLQQLVEDYTPAAPSTIYDRNNKEIDVLYTESRELASIREIPDSLKNAFMAIEDKKFYSHSGIHLKGILRAIVNNIKKGKATQGGSSITQQLAKNAFLTSERKLSRKIKEAILTFEMERTYTKDEILEKYLNEIYFGSGSYGVKTAAKQFFQKDIKDLNIAESALLAGIPNRPSKYDPVRNLENALSRQKIILKEMLSDKRISQEEYNRAIAHEFIVDDENNKRVSNESLTVIYPKKNNKFYKNPEFTVLVEDFLQELYSDDEIFKGGLKIYTTLDLDYQKIAKEVFDNYETLKNSDLDGAMITVDPFTGGIISIIGGKDFKAKNFNRALMAKRQYGSSFKPFLYLLAMKNGFNPYSVVVDDYFVRGSWAPKNYGGNYSGNSTLLNSLNHSLNIPAIKLLEEIGVEKFADETKNLKYSGKIKDLTAALGSVEVSPINLAMDFSIFVNGGNMIEANLIREVRDTQDTLIYVADVKKERIFDSLDTSVITAMLKTVVSNGTGSRAKVYDKNGKAIEQGGKTGTTNENRTIWYAGITPEYVTVAYIGRDDNKPVLGKVTGGGVVAPLWARYYQRLIKENLYSPGKFEFLENHLEAGELMKQNINIYNGLLSSEKSRTVIVPKGRLQVESEVKYRRGIATVFGLDAQVGTGEGNSEIYFNPDINTSTENSDNDGLFNRLLGE